MSDIVRMLRVSESDPVQQEAADEIERLRAELAAEREKTADYGKQIDRLADEIDWGEDEVVAQEKALEEVEAERDALRAKLDVACEALEPFAAAEVYCGSQNTDPDDEVVKWLFAIGHIRRARFVLEKIKGGGDE